MGFKHFVINKYEPENDERRLTELAAKGEFIKSYSDLLAYFKNGEPKKMRYCIEAGIVRPSRKKLRFYEESGWKLVCRGSDLTVFASEDENAVPIHTDRSEYAHVIQRFHRTAVKIFILLLTIVFVSFTELFWLLPLVTKETVMYWAKFDDYLPPPLFLRITLLQWLFMTPFLLFYFRDAVNAGKFVAGSIENWKSASKAVLLNRVLTASLAVTLAIGAGCTAFICYASAVSGSSEVPMSCLPAEAPGIESFFPTGSLIPADDTENMEHYAEKFDGSKFENKAVSYTSAVTDEYFNYRQYGAYVPDGSDKGILITTETDYIRFKSELLAKTAVNDIIRWEREILIHPKTSALIEFNSDGTGWDSIVCLESERDKRFMFILRKGSAVTRISFFKHDGVTPESIYKNAPIMKGK